MYRGAGAKLDYETDLNKFSASKSLLILFYMLSKPTKS